MFTLAGPASETAPPPATDRVADELLQRDEDRKEKARERVRRFRQREKDKEAAAEAKPSLVATPEDERETAIMFDFLWGLAVVPAAKGRLRMLNEAQALRGGKVLAPLVKKYLPMIADWQLEVSALLFVASVVKECHVEVPKDENAGTGGQPDSGRGGPEGLGEIHAGA